MPRQLRVVSPVALIQEEALFTAHSGPAIFGLMINHSNLPTCSGSNAWFSSKSVTPSPAFHLTAALADCVVGELIISLVDLSRGEADTAIDKIHA